LYRPSCSKIYSSMSSCDIWRPRPFPPGGHVPSRLVRPRPFPPGSSTSHGTLFSWSRCLSRRPQGKYQPKEYTRQIVAAAASCRCVRPQRSHIAQSQPGARTAPWRRLWYKHWPHLSRSTTNKLFLRPPCNRVTPFRTFLKYTVKVLAGRGGIDRVSLVKKHNWPSLYKVLSFNVNCAVKVAYRPSQWNLMVPST